MGRKVAAENTDRRKRVRSLVAEWYSDRCDERKERYRAVRNRPVMIAPRTPALGKGHPAQQWDKPLTAAARETRDPKSFGSNRPPGPMEVDAGGGQVANNRLVIVRYAMLLVINEEPLAHHALEMDAAGYPIQEIAAELGCGEPKAREYIQIGLAIVGVVYRLRRDLHVYGVDRTELELEDEGECE